MIKSVSGVTNLLNCINLYIKISALEVPLVPVNSVCSSPKELILFKAWSNCSGV